MSQLFTWGGQNTGVSTLALFLPKKSQGWSSSEWTGWWLNLLPTLHTLFVIRIAPSLLFSRSVVSNSLQPQGLQHTRTTVLHFSTYENKIDLLQTSHSKLVFCEHLMVKWMRRTITLCTAFHLKNLKTYFAKQFNNCPLQFIQSTKQNKAL